MKRREPGAGQESVWDYPRPPRVEPTERRVEVRFNGVSVADSRKARRVLETSHPPVYYIPPGDVRIELLVPSGRRTWCEFKGAASYYDLRVDDATVEDAAWCYPDPVPAFESIRDHIAFYPSKMACFVGGERVLAQDGDFYGGWITRDIVGPFKGGAGTRGW